MVACWAFTFTGAFPVTVESALFAGAGKLKDKKKEK
jgi:hypothetical protein